jgi:hypothetical protein
MIDLGIMDKPILGEGKPITSKRVPKNILIKSIKAVCMMEMIK